MLQNSFFRIFLLVIVSFFSCQAINGQSVECDACLMHPGKCPTCYGSRKMKLVTNSGTQYVPCTACNGTGVCPSCNGAAGNNSSRQAMTSKPSYDSKSTSIGGSYNPPKTWRNDYIPESLNELNRDFKTENDNNGTRYVPKNVQYGESSNAVFFYFTQSQNGSVGNLRLRIQNYADMHVNFKDVEFIIDGQKYRLSSSSVKRGKNKSRYWEVFDEPLSYKHRDFVYSLAHCSYAEVVLLAKTNHRIYLKQEQIDAFSKAFKLYLKCGGNF